MMNRLRDVPIAVEGWVFGWTSQMELISCQIKNDAFQIAGEIFYFGNAILSLVSCQCGHFSSLLRRKFFGEMMQGDAQILWFTH